MQLKYLKLCGKTSDSIAVETPLPWLHVATLKENFFKNSFFIKFTQSISRIGWACMGSARIPYLPSLQRIYFSTTEFFPVFVCLFYYYHYYFFFTKLHVGTWTLVVHPQTSFLTVETFHSIPALPSHLLSEYLVIVQLVNKFPINEVQSTKSKFSSLKKQLAY